MSTKACLNYNPLLICASEFAKIREQPGDALYVRALYDHSGSSGGDGAGSGELAFSKNDILFVDDTTFQGQLGMWRAWRVDNQGNKLCCGSVWSKARYAFLSLRFKREGGIGVLGIDFSLILGHGINWVLIGGLGQNMVLVTLLMLLYYYERITISYFVFHVALIF